MKSAPSLIATLIVLLGSVGLVAQDVACERAFDKEAAVAKARRFGVKMDSRAGHWSGISLDTTNCSWEVWSMKTKHIERGDCKRTNGCTLYKEITVILNADTGKLKSRRRERRKIHNYE